MLRLLLPLLAALFLLPLALAQGLGVSTSYWPVLSPSSTVPWIRGQKNRLSWRVAGGTGVAAFEIELHHWSRKVMNGAIKIATRFPNEPLPGRYGNLGGEIEIDISDKIPTGDGFFIAFSSAYHGKVYALSEPFAILDAAPSNYTEPTGSASVTASITDTPRPLDQYILTMSGKSDETSKPAPHTLTSTESPAATSTA